MPRETGGVQEVGHGGGAAEQRVVVRRDLVQPRPAPARLHAGARRRRRRAARNRSSHCGVQVVSKPSGCRGSARPRSSPSSMLWKYAEEAKSIVTGMRGAAGVSATVKASCRFSGRTGSSTPAMAPTRADQAPPRTRPSHETGPWSVCTTVTAVTGHIHAGDRGVRGENGSGEGGGARVPLDDEGGPGVAVGGGVGGGEEAVGADVGAEGPGLFGTDHAAGDAELVLAAHAVLELRHLPRVGQQEEIADGVEADAGAGAARELREGAQTPLPQLDVERIGELRPHPADRLARTAAAECAALDDDDVTYAGLGEMEGDARPHHPAADDHDLGGGREGPVGGRGPRRRFRRGLRRGFPRRFRRRR